MPVCEVCNDGYFWNITWAEYEEDETTIKKTHPGFCERCGYSIKDCLACSSASHCLECQHDLLVSPSGAKCLPHLPNCALLSSSYTVNELEDRYECPVCNDGYFYNQTSGGCSLCEDEIEGCLKCTNDLVCLDCEDTLFPDPTGSSCLLPFVNCVVD